MMAFLLIVSTNKRAKRVVVITDTTRHCSALSCPDHWPFSTGHLSSTPPTLRTYCILVRSVRNVPLIPLRDYGISQRSINSIWYSQLTSPTFCQNPAYLPGLRNYGSRVACWADSEGENWLVTIYYSPLVQRVFQLVLHWALTCYNHVATNYKHNYLWPSMWSSS